MARCWLGEGPGRGEKRTAEGHAGGALKPRQVGLGVAAELVARDEDREAAELAIGDGGVLGGAERAQHRGGVVVRRRQAHALERHCAQLRRVAATGAPTACALVREASVAWTCKPVNCPALGRVEVGRTFDLWQVQAALGVELELAEGSQDLALQVVHL